MMTSMTLLFKSMDPRARKGFRNPPDKDWGKGAALQIEQALGESRGRHLHPALVAAVDLQVVSVSGVQPQEASP